MSSTSDGHTGLGIEKQKVYSISKHFNFTSATLKDSSGDVDIVLYASSNLISQRPFQFLDKIGFSHFSGQCPFYYDRCFFRTIAIVKGSMRDFIDNFWEVQGIYENISRFIEKIDELYALYEGQNNILQWIGQQAHMPTIFTSPPMIEVATSDVPPWTEEVKFNKLKDLESKAWQIEKDIGELRGFLPLLYASGDPLVDGVIKALCCFGLQTQRTEKGFTVDVTAQTQDGSRKFGFEITGISEAIKKSSKKLIQVVDFERIKENNEKTILVANTYNTTPIPERKSKENFTIDAVDFLKPFPILLMTAYDLYKMIQDVIENGKNPEDIISMLYNSVGVLSY